MKNVQIGPNKYIKGTSIFQISESLPIAFTSYFATVEVCSYWASIKEVVSKATK